MRIGIDVGGTHTDAVLVKSNEVVASCKVLTSQNISDGLLNALDSLLRQASSEPADLQAVMIGTTQFTNAVVERRSLEQVAVIRVGLPSGASIPPTTGWPDDLVAAVNPLVFMISGGHTYDGLEISPLDLDALDSALQKISEQGIRQIAVASIFAPSDPAQELAIEQHILRQFPQMDLTLSHRIGQLGLLERENAAILNASLKPLAQRVISSFGEALASRSISCPFYISQNDGTLMDEVMARQFPALTFSSGPTNSLRGASLLTGLEDAIVIDIGGTTSDIGVLKGGFPRQSNLSASVGGVRTNFRMPDILPLGLGGGSIVKPDGSQIGPVSVGYQLPQMGRVFGGDTLTATDIAVASGGADLGDASLLQDLPASLIASVNELMHQMLDEGVDRMKSSRDPVPVILVGGGALLVSKPLKQASTLLKPEYSGVANAIGAAHSQIGCDMERMIVGDASARRTVLEEMKLHLRDQLRQAGGKLETARIADQEETAVSYMATPAVRVRMKMVADLDLPGEAHAAG